MDGDLDQDFWDRLLRVKLHPFPAAKPAKAAKASPRPDDRRSLPRRPQRCHRRVVPRPVRGPRHVLAGAAAASHSHSKRRSGRSRQPRAYGRLFQFVQQLHGEAGKVGAGNIPTGPRKFRYALRTRRRLASAAMSLTCQTPTGFRATDQNQCARGNSTGIRQGRIGIPSPKSVQVQENDPGIGFSELGSYLGIAGPTQPPGGPGRNAIPKFRPGVSAAFRTVEKPSTR
jgi:hypothetical protein